MRKTAAHNRRIKDTSTGFGELNPLNKPYRQIVVEVRNLGQGNEVDHLSPVDRRPRQFTLALAAAQ